ncbi:hypothetical protein HPB50_025820 [Hyalomma asiaticum]|uniref:Uncharacterized protein n=1 Tax=Hyalomma asiaticum TaxID=266040 RepID=A0ACB7STS6_HYAAI|nr:hypothetical protein HPB50_025820 [Hyalomma asiaticum]
MTSTMQIPDRIQAPYFTDPVEAEAQGDGHSVQGDGEHPGGAHINAGEAARARWTPHTLANDRSKQRSRAVARRRRRRGTAAAASTRPGAPLLPLTPARAAQARRRSTRRAASPSLARAPVDRCARGHRGRDMCAPQLEREVLR